MRIFYSSLVLALSVFISGCGGSGSSEVSESYTTIEGRVVDGEIKDATVFFDLNANGILDSGEPSVKSDEQGKFKLELKESLASDYTVAVVASGGYDIREAEAFNQTLMAFREESSNSVAITPLSTLIAYDIISNSNYKDTAEFFKLLEASKDNFAKLFGLESDIVVQDPIELALNDNLELLEINMKIARVAKEIQKAIKQSYQNEQSALLKSYKAYSQALLQLNAENKQKDEALKSSADVVKLIEPTLFDDSLIEVVDKSLIEILDTFNSSWQDSLDDIKQTLQSSSGEFVKFNQDTTPPIITLYGDANISLEANSTYIELGAYAIDNKDGVIDVEIENSIDITKVGSYEVIYNAVDSSGNSAKSVRVVNITPIPDLKAPTITLNGDTNMSVILGNSYIEPGATAVDNVDGEVNVTIQSSVDDKNLGEYNVTYSAVDSSGNEAVVVRVVNVIDPKVIVEDLNITDNKCNSWQDITIYPDSNNSDYYYIVNNNDWGRQYLDSNSTGIQCVFKYIKDTKEYSGWYWGWPDNNDYQVKGYPEAIYGAKFSRIINPESGFPALVSTINSVNVELAYQDMQYTNRYNTALEFWLHTDSETSMDNIEYEIMFRFDPSGFHPTKIKIGEYEINGVTFDVYTDKEYDGTTDRKFINFVAREKVTTLSVDFKKVLDYLTDLEFSDIPDRYMSGIEMGVEVISGSGALLLEQLDVNLQLNN